MILIGVDMYLDLVVVVDGFFCCYECFGFG